MKLEKVSLGRMNEWINEYNKSEYLLTCGIYFKLQIQFYKSKRWFSNRRNLTQWYYQVFSAKIREKTTNCLFLISVNLSYLLYLLGLGNTQRRFSVGSFFALVYRGLFCWIQFLVDYFLKWVNILKWHLEYATDQILFCYFRSRFNFFIDKVQGFITIFFV